MASCKDHTDISLDNILKLAVESLTAEEQQHYEDYMRQAKEKFLSQYTVGRHQKFVKHRETDVASLLTSLQVPNVSKPMTSNLLNICRSAARSNKTTDWKVRRIN
jgi:hypothetical protein